ncbi:MAG: SsrA-binding protein, partial [Terriglobia bacterium]
MAARTGEQSPKNLAVNRQAGHFYNLLEKYECGIELTGTEVKAIREGKASLKDGYA